jgi:ABC-2 type transport system ATP-binding protein
MSLLEAAHLRKSYNGTLAVDDLSFSLDAGEVLGLLGPNGAGKTTTMLMLAGLLRPSGGAVTLDGRPFDPDDPALRPMLGVVPQDLAVYPDLTACENLQFFGRLYGVRGAELEQRTGEVLERIGLANHIHAASRTFSGGMKRRLNFGVALMHRPRVLILDEPTVGVDPQSRSHLLDCVRDLARAGVGVIYASHYMEEVQAICQRVAIVDHGRLVAYDAVERLLASVSPTIHVHVVDPDSAARVLDALARPSVADNGDRVLAVSGNADRSVNQALLKVLEALNQAGIEVDRVDTQEASLERLFLQLTGHQLRD